jgi:hypothetical protein
MTKLHEIIAVESGLMATARQINDEAKKLFGGKPEQFIETVTQLTHFNESDTHLDEIKRTAMTTTVPDKLLYIVSANVKALDAYLTKSKTNQTATADIEIDGVTIATSVPGTALLDLETRLTELREVFAAIPTLAPGKSWKRDEDARKGGGVYVTEFPDINYRTRKTVRPIIMSPATKEHPAQVQAVSEDVPIGKFTATTKSGMMTSADKSDLLARLDRLLRAVKRARQRANGAEVVKGKIGQPLFDYLYKDIIA